MATTNKVTGLEKFTESYKSSLGGNFSRYPVKFDTKKINKQVTRSYGSLKSGNIGIVNGFKAKDESWRMLNVLLHDRSLHQRYGRTLVRATHEMDDKTKNIKRKLRSITNNG